MLAAQDALDDRGAEIQAAGAIGQDDDGLARAREAKHERFEVAVVAPVPEGGTKGAEVTGA
jgi:hypothetical protein